MKIWENIKKRKYLKIIIGVTVGSFLGFAYYHFVGCNSGSCPITSNPWASIAYGGFAGFVLTFNTKTDKK